MKLIPILTAIVLYVIFTIASLLAGVIGLVALCFGRTRYTTNVSHAMDMTLAALLGWNGRSTVSKECGKSDCRFCRVLCAILHRILEKNHCEKEGRRS